VKLSSVSADVADLARVAEVIDHEEERTNPEGTVR
jgi:hypothetical protein